MDWCCDDCRAHARRDLRQVMVEASCDQRVASVVILSLHRVVEQLKIASGSHVDRYYVRFTTGDSSITRIFGLDDAAKPLHAESRYWAVLTSMAHTLHAIAGISSSLEPSSSCSHHADNAMQAAVTMQPSISCGIKAMDIVWSYGQGPGLARACGQLMHAWYGSHAAACMPGYNRASLENVSQAARQSIGTRILGAQEQQLTTMLLQANASDHQASPATGTADRTEHTRSMMAALPFCWKLDWRVLGKSEYQGQALLTLTNGSGIFMCTSIRSVPLIRTGGKAKGSSLSWPGRLGQAAKASKGPPGQAEDLAVKRRRQKRHAAARAAVEYAEEMARQLPPGSIIFPAVLTSEFEGLQVAAARAQDKERQAALMCLMLGLPAKWPANDIPDAAHGKRRTGRKGKGGKNRVEGHGTAHEEGALSNGPGLQQGGSQQAKNGPRRGRKGRGGKKAQAEASLAPWPYCSWWGSSTSGEGRASGGVDLAVPSLLVAGALVAGVACFVMLRRRT